MKSTNWFSLIAAGFVLLSIAEGSSGSTFVVTSANDGDRGSLRAAIARANAHGKGNIRFSNVGAWRKSGAGSAPGGLRSGGSSLVLTGELRITGHLMIDGAGAGNLLLDGDATGRVLRVMAGSISSIMNLTITNGRAGGSGGGGGILNSGHLTLSNCVVAGNTFFAPSGGGGIYNNGTLLMDRCVVTGNQCWNLFDNSAAAMGGGIYNAAILHLSDSLVTSNSLERMDLITPFSEPPNGLGAGIYNAGTAVLTRSSLLGNSTADGTSSDGRGGEGGSGAGFFNDWFAVFNACTVANNGCGDGGHAGGWGFDATGGKGGSGGGIYNAGTLSLTNTTLYANATGNGGQGGNTFSFPAGAGGAGGDGGNLYNSGVAYLTSATIAAGSVGGGGLGGYTFSPFTYGDSGVSGVGGGLCNASGSVQIWNSIVASNSTDVFGTVISSGHNLVGITSGSAGFSSVNDLLNADARIGALANHGGPTLTCPLLAGSPAIDAGDDLLTGTDQRGYSRPSGAHVDIGAFEVQVPDGLPSLVAMGSHRRGFRFDAKPGALFAILASTNVTLPVADWPIIGTAVESSAGHFHFFDATRDGSQCFYRVRSP
jgi:hypothetical protein